jgi:hypothetical protein
MTAATLSWTERAAALTLDGRCVIEGQRRDAADGSTFAKHSPIDARRLGSVARGQAADIDAAVASARPPLTTAAGPGGLRPHARRCCRRFAEKILAAKDELALLETLDMGKPIQFALHGGRARRGALHPVVRGGDRQGLRRDRAHRAACALALITREAVGVIGCRRALELPDDHGCLEARPCTGRRQLRGAQAQRKVAATPRCGWLSWLLEAGLPPGVLQRGARLRPRSRRGAGAAHAGRRHRLHRIHPHRPAHARLRGSIQPEAGVQRVGRQVGIPRLPDDFADIDRAAADRGRAACSSIRARAAMRRRACWCTSVLPTPSLNACWRHAPKPGSRPIRWRPATVMGALVDETQLRTVMGYIEAGREQGARCVAGGRQARTETGGYYVEPTVFDGVTPADDDRAGRDLRPGHRA